MKGRVDEHGRALIEIEVSQTQDADRVPITAWIDTAFDGHLVLSSELIADLGLEPLVETEAILADCSLFWTNREGRSKTLQTSFGEPAC